MTAYYNEFDPFAASWLEELIEDGLIAPGVVDRRSIVDVVPSDLKGYTQCHFFAGIGVWSLALRIAEWPDDRPVWTGSCPCFVSGTLILTKRGLIPIEQVVRGDEVLTHRNRWRRVSQIGSEFSETVTVKGQGHWGMDVTPGHPFYARKRSRDCKRQSPTYGKIVLGDVKWLRADALTGSSWATVSNIPEMRLPCRSDSEFARFLGFFVGNGWTNANRVIICDHVGSENALIEIVAPVCGESHSVERGHTGDKVMFSDAVIAGWLRDEFGCGASKKKLPTWLLSAPLDFLKSFIAGWFEADGHLERRGQAWTTTSRNLAVGLRIILNRLGLAASIDRIKPADKHVIEGRVVNANPWYRVTSSDRSTSFKFTNDHGWGAVRKITHSGIAVRVFNMSVEEDESYTADGIVVHNCQPFSAAGKGDGFDDERHLWPAFHWHIAYGKPVDVPVVGEQVASKAGRAWFDLVQSDMEALDHACGAVDTSAAGNGAPFIGQRLYWLATTACGGSSRVSRGRSEQTERTAEQGTVGGLAPPDSGQCDRWAATTGGDNCGRYDTGRAQGDCSASTCDQPDRLAPSDSEQYDRAGQSGQGWWSESPDHRDALHGIPLRPTDFWSDPDWLLCRDPDGARFRPVEPSTLIVADGRAIRWRMAEGSGEGGQIQTHFPLAQAKEYLNRLDEVRGAGNALNVAQAANFISAVMEYLDR